MHPLSLFLRDLRRINLQWFVLSGQGAAKECLQPLPSVASDI